MGRFQWMLTTTDFLVLVETEITFMKADVNKYIFTIVYWSQKPFWLTTYSSMEGLPLPNLLIWAIYGSSIEMIWHNLWALYGQYMDLVWFPYQIHVWHCLHSVITLLFFSKIQLVIHHQCCVLIGWATSRLYVIAR